MKDNLFCPYCDGLHRINIVHDEIENDNVTQYRVICYKCKTSTSYFDTGMEALAAWFAKYVT